MLMALPKRSLRLLASFAFLSATTFFHLAGCGPGETDSNGQVPVKEACVPSKNPNPVEADCGFFVRTSGNDMAAGTKQAPVATLARAIELAGAGTGKAVYACAETFPEAVAVPAGVTIFGGLDCKVATWPYKSREGRTTIAPEPDKIPLTFAKGAAATHIENIVAQAADASAPSGSSIAVLAEGATVNLVLCDLIAGAGATGAIGATPADSIGPTDPSDPAIMGNPGTIACMGGPSGNVGGVEKPNALCPESIGGAGGTGLAEEGKAGSPGKPEDETFGHGGLGSTGGNCMDGGNGQPGVEGTPGTGATAESIGSISAKGYAGPAAPSGGIGTPGQGGGGGGGAKGKANCFGASGGSGGAGGCGGNGGLGGNGGGSSFALVSVGATFTFDQVTLTAGAGGTGGEGGIGQEGAIGGSGGTGGAQGTGTLAACKGGDGGPGGRGGKGGGGIGGHSAGIAFKGVSPSTAGATIKIGAPGAGGAGEGESGTGAPGIAADTIEFK